MPIITVGASSRQRPPASRTRPSLASFQRCSESSRTPSRSKITASGMPGLQHGYRAGMSPAVFMSEHEEPGHPDDGTWLTGRFCGSLQGSAGVLESFGDLALDEALAWARSRAGRVLIRYGEEPDVHY